MFRPRMVQVETEILRIGKKVRKLVSKVIWRVWRRKVVDLRRF